MITDKIDSNIAKLERMPPDNDYNSYISCRQVRSRYYQKVLQSKYFPFDGEGIEWSKFTHLTLLYRVTQEFPKSKLMQALQIWPNLPQLV